MTEKISDIVDIGIHMQISDEGLAVTEKCNPELAKLIRETQPDRITDEYKKWNKISQIEKQNKMDYMEINEILDKIMYGFRRMEETKTRNKKILQSIGKWEEGMFDGIDKWTGNYPIEFKEIRPYILERDKYKCVFCDDSSSLIVHHIDNNKANNSPDNLIVACVHHHHSKPIHYYKKFDDDVINMLKDLAIKRTRQSDLF